MGITDTKSALKNLRTGTYSYAKDLKAGVDTIGWWSKVFKGDMIDATMLPKPEKLPCGLPPIETWSKLKRHVDFQDLTVDTEENDKQAALDAQMYVNMYKLK